MRAREGNNITYDKGVKIVRCPIEQEYCYPSCYWRKGDRCYFKSKRGRQLSELKVSTKHIDSQPLLNYDAHGDINSG